MQGFKTAHRALLALERQQEQTETLGDHVRSTPEPKISKDEIKILFQKHWNVLIANSTLKKFDVSH